jgi:hypothetical protein
MSYWIQTFSGKRFDLENPQPADVDIVDIIQALSNICRFNGHCRQRYTVLEHSVRVAEIVPEEFRFTALLHDAGEAYYGDITRPLKMVLHELTKYETRCGPAKPFQWFLDKIDAAIASAFGTTYPLPECVKHADDVLLATEARDLMGPPPEPWVRLPDPLPDVITPMYESVAYTRFVEMFHAYKPSEVR